MLIQIELPKDEDVESSLEAIRGNSVPPEHLLEFTEAQISIIHGIRHHAAFADSAPTVRLCPTNPAFGPSHARGTRGSS